MTDNRTTELREKLTERGVEYTTREGMKATSITHITHWYADGVDAEFTEQIKGCTRLTASGLTPEQAIAATLGSRRNTSLDNVDAERDAEFAKAMRRIVERNTEFGVTDIEESHIKADELMCDLLLAHGYTETVDAFKNMRKWYG